MIGYLEDTGWEERSSFTRKFLSVAWVNSALVGGNIVSFLFSWSVYAREKFEKTTVTLMVAEIYINMQIILINTIGLFWKLAIGNLIKF